LEKAPHISLHVGLPEQACLRPTADGSLKFPEFFPHAGCFGGRTEKQLGQRSVTPVLVDVLQLTIDLGFGESPRETGKVLSEPRRREEKDQRA
jgi:hypothetical protein